MHSGSLSLLIIFILKIDGSYSLYEDQIGKFDWTENLIGPVKNALFLDSTGFSKALFVATKENVVASLFVDTGEIIWRKVLEKGTRGRINTFCSYGHTIYAVTGSNVILVRGWDAKYGYLIYQWSIDLPPSENSERVLWHCKDNKLYRLLFTPEQLLHLISWRIQDGEKFLERNISFHQDTLDSKKCAISNGILLCLNQPNFIVMNVTSQTPVFRELSYTNNHAEYHSIRASLTPGKTVFTLNTNVEKFSLMIDDNLNTIKSESIAADLGDISLCKLSCDDSVIAVSSTLTSENILEVKAYETGVMKTVFLHRFDLKTFVKEVEILALDCAIQISGHKVYSILLGSYDGSLIFLKSSGELKWIREEGLANIVSAEIIELPMSDTEAEMQNEFDTNESNAFKMLVRRFSSHAFQFQKLLLGIFGMLEKSFSKKSHESDLVRDYFNLHKIILIINKQLKIFAIDNVSKRILWTYLVDNNFEAFPAPCTSCEVRIPIFIQRTYRHYPRPMVYTFLIRDKVTKNGVILTFNPLSGIFQPAVPLDFKIKQAMLLPQESPDDHLQGIMILKEDNSIFVYPEHAASVIPEIAHNLYIYTGDKDSCEVNGYTFSPNIRNMSLIPAWNMKCTGRIVKILGKNPIEKVHSQGRVMADRSVLYKYINPNLIVILSQSINAEDQKSMLTLYFVDSVTGVIVNGDVRHRASDPVHAIHSENWIILMYFNDKAKRTEIVTYELYEGKTQKNSTAFSSTQNKLLRPIIDSRAYILPSSHIEAAAETITEKGITSKQILVAVGTGNIIELPWVILDPRRPYVSAPESKEEGVLPYMPEIPVPTDRIINYNITLNRIRGIVTSPSGLESTSLIFAYGLDLFYTRTAPSKTFDLLKEDFDYVLIIIVLVLLVVLTCFTKHLAYRRALRQVWR